MKFCILFWYIGILHSDVLSLRPTTPMRPPEESQAAKVAQMINFVNTLKKRVSFLGYDKRRTELSHVEEIKPWIANLYKVLLSKEEQTSREYTQKLANMARYYVIDNPEVLDEFGKKKIKRKKDIRRPSYESAASSDPVSESETSSVEPRYKGLGRKSLKRRYDMEFLPDPEANSKEFNIGKKEDEFGQLVLKNFEEKDVIFQPVDENGPKFEPDLDFNINEKENVKPKSIFGETLDNVKSSEIEITTESAPTTDYNKDQNVIKGKYIKAEEVRNDHQKKRPLEPKTDDGDYDRGTYQNHRPDEISPKKEENETKTDLGYRVEEIKETELNNYLKGYGQQKRFREEQRLKSVEVNNKPKNNGAQDVTIDPQRTDKHKDVDKNETIDPHKHKDLNKNQRNDEKIEPKESKERKPQTNEWDLKGKENEYKYEGNEKIKDQNNDDQKRNLNENEDNLNKNTNPSLKNENNNKDNDNQKYDNENQKKIEWTKDDDRNMKDRDNVMKDHHDDRNQRNLEQNHNDYDRPDDKQRYDDRDHKNYDQGRYDDWNTKRNDRDRKHNDWDNKESNMNKNNDWGSNNNDWKNNNNNKNDWATNNNDWGTNNDNYGKKNERNEKNIDWDTKNYDGDNKRDDWNINQDWNTKKEDLIEKQTDWNTRKDAWNEKQSWNTKPDDWNTKKTNWNTEKDDWNTNKYNADNNNNQNYNRHDTDRNNNGHDKRHDIDNTNYWDRNDKTKRKDNWDDDADWKKDDKKVKKKHNMEIKDDWKEYSVDNKKKVTDEPKNSWDTVGTKQKKPKGGGHKKKKVLKQGPVEVFKPIEKDFNIDAEPVKQKTPSSWDDYVPKNNDDDDNYKPIKKKKRGSYERSKNNQPNHSAFGRTPIPFAGKKRIYAD